MWRSRALALVALVGGLGIAAPAAAASSPPATSASAVTAQSDTAGQQPAAEVASCRATVIIAGQWTGGFYGQVTVGNTGTVPIRWRVTLTIPGARIIPPPGYIVVQEGANWLIYPPPASSWNGILPVGASTIFGFTGSVTGTLGTPTVTCTATPA